MCDHILIVKQNEQSNIGIRFSQFSKEQNYFTLREIANNYNNNYNEIGFCPLCPLCGERLTDEMIKQQFILAKCEAKQIIDEKCVKNKVLSDDAFDALRNVEFLPIN